jgi:hypothetical protein
MEDQPPLRDSDWWSAAADLGCLPWLLRLCDLAMLIEPGQGPEVAIDQVSRYVGNPDAMARIGYACRWR